MNEHRALQQRAWKFLEVPFDTVITIDADFTKRKSMAIQQRVLNFVESVEDLPSHEQSIQAQKFSDELTAEARNITELYLWQLNNRKRTGLKFTDKNSNSKWSRVLASLITTHQTYIDRIAVMYL